MTSQTEHLLIEKHRLEKCFVGGAYSYALTGFDDLMADFHDLSPNYFSQKECRKFWGILNKTGDPTKAAIDAEIYDDINTWYTPPFELPGLASSILQFHYKIEISKYPSRIVKAISNNNIEEVRRLTLEMATITPFIGSLEKPDLSFLTADALLDMVFTDPLWAVPGILPVGLAILGGKAKVGKSWLALQIALAVGAGGSALGEKVEDGRVCYLALEDSPRRLQERMKKMSWPRGLPVEFLTMEKFRSELGYLQNGGGEQLANRIYNIGYRLIVIDTLSRSVSGKQNEVADMTDALSPIQIIGHQAECAILLIDHHSKLTGHDPDAVLDILGSTAKGAVADTALGLYRERGKKGAKLQVTGRDVEERTLSLNFDPTTGAWQVEGDADEIQMTERRQEIIDAITGMGSSTVTDIANAIGQDKGNTYKRIQDLANNGLLRRLGKDKYALP